MIDADSDRYIQLAASTHRDLARVRELCAEVEHERRRVVKLAVASGATHQEIADALEVSRVRITTLVNGPMR